MRAGLFPRLAHSSWWLGSEAQLSVMRKGPRRNGREECHEVTGNDGWALSIKVWGRTWIGSGGVDVPWDGGWEVGNQKMSGRKIMPLAPSALASS